MFKMINHLNKQLLILISFSFYLLTCNAASAEWEFGIYGGYNHTFDSNVGFKDPGTQVLLNAVSWQGVSFQAPPYYGVRTTYWFEKNPNWGLMLDFTHAKMKADKSEAVRVNGISDGHRIDENIRIGDEFSRLEFTDGNNLLLLNAVYRMPMHRGVTPYIGAGVGVAIPHVEVQFSGDPDRTFEYQLTGIAAQFLTGIKWNISENWALFGEYKLSYAKVDAKLVGDEKLQTELWTNHFLVGVSFTFK